VDVVAGAGEAAGGPQRIEAIGATAPGRRRLGSAGSRTTIGGASSPGRPPHTAAGGPSAANGCTIVSREREKWVVATRSPEVERNSRFTIPPRPCASETSDSVAAAPKRNRPNRSVAPAATGTSSTRSPTLRSAVSGQANSSTRPSAGSPSAPTRVPVTTTGATGPVPAHATAGSNPADKTVAVETHSS